MLVLFTFSNLRTSFKILELYFETISIFLFSRIFLWNCEHVPTLHKFSLILKYFRICENSLNFADFLEILCIFFLNRWMLIMKFFEFAFKKIVNMVWIWIFYANSRTSFEFVNILFETHECCFWIGEHFLEIGKTLWNCWSFCCFGEHFWNQQRFSETMNIFAIQYQFFEFSEHFKKFMHIL